MAQRLPIPKRRNLCFWRPMSAASFSNLAGHTCSSIATRAAQQVNWAVSITILARISTIDVWPPPSVVAASAILHWRRGWWLCCVERPRTSPHLLLYVIKHVLHCIEIEPVLPLKRIFFLSLLFLFPFLLLPSSFLLPLFSGSSLIFSSAKCIGFLFHSLQPFQYIADFFFRISLLRSLAACTCGLPPTGLLICIPFSFNSLVFAVETISFRCIAQSFPRTLDLRNGSS